MVKPDTYRSGDVLAVIISVFKLTMFHRDDLDDALLGHYQKALDAFSEAHEALN